MYYGQITLNVEGWTDEERNDKMNRLFQFLADNVDEYDYHGFEETEKHWNDYSRAGIGKYTAD